MKAIIYETFKGDLAIENLPDPEPLEDGVVLKVSATGLCRSDWHGWMGHDADITLPHVPGHELAGEIIELGMNVTDFKIGDRVTLPFVGGCGNCEQCNSGNQQVCDRQFQPGFTHWGSFAEYVAIDYANTNLVQLPESIDDQTAALLGCRFITAYRALIDQGRLKTHHTVAIHGCGGVGQSAIMIANAIGAEIFAVDINPEALKKAQELGAKHVINAKNNPFVVEEIRDKSHGGVNLSLDALGSQVTCFNSISCLRKRGKHIQVGLMTGKHKHPKIPMDLIIANELEILGSHGMQAHRYPEMLKMITSGKLNPKLMIEKSISLDEATKALPAMDLFQHKGVFVIDKF